MSSENRPSVTTEEIASWLDVLYRYTDEHFSQAALKTPPSATVLDSSKFADAVEAEAEAKTEVSTLAGLVNHPAYKPILHLNAERRKKLGTELSELEEQRRSLVRSATPWQESATQDFISGRGARWIALADLTRARLAEMKQLLERLGSKVVVLPDRRDLRKLRADAFAAATFLSASGKWKRFGLFTPSELKGRDYLLREVSVSGESPTTPALLLDICNHLDLEFALVEVSRSWTEVGINTAGADRLVCIAMLSEQLSILDKCQQFAERCRRLGLGMSKVDPPIPEPDWLAGQGKDWLDVLRASLVEETYRQRSADVDQFSRAASGLGGLHDAHPVVEYLVDAIERRDTQAYSRAADEILTVEQTRTARALRNRVEGILNKTVPGLVSAVTSTKRDTEWVERFGAWENAWAWAAAENWLKKRSDLNYQRGLWESRHQTDIEISQLLAEAAALRAWAHFFERLSPRQANALKGWRATVKAIGKGTGRSAKVARLRKEARTYMDICRDAIPVWIMPRFLVAEMLEPAPNQYDLVIVDEASQLGIDSLFLFYIAKKLVVVGDDQQISPYGVGIKADEIASYQRKYLRGIPHQIALLEKSSLYENAKIRFSKNLVLREHFRCMPEIIQFSNDLCYAPHGTPLDPLRAYPASRLLPIVSRLVNLVNLD